MHLQVREIVIVEPRALQTLVVQSEAQRLHQMQRRARVRAKPNRIARVRRDLRCIQHDMKHRLSVENDALRRQRKLDAEAPELVDDLEIHDVL